MRNLEELLKTQIVSSESTINHALQMNEELDRLRKECQNLRIKCEASTPNKKIMTVERDEYLNTIQALKKELKKIQTASESREERLQLQLNQLQASWNSLYDDLAKVRDERDELKAKLEDEEEKVARTNCAEKASGAEAGRMDQAELLRLAVNRHNSFSSSVSSLERAIRNLEIENLKQKSTIVKLQTQLKEERYQKERTVSQSSPVRVHPTSPVPSMRSFITQSIASPPFAARSPMKMWPVDDHEDRCLPSSLALGENDVDAAPKETTKSPTKSKNAQRIQEYELKKDTIVSDDEAELKDDTRSVSTSSTKSSTISTDSTPSLLSRRSRAQSLHPPSMAQGNATHWGRSPTRNLTRENHTILTTHPAYLTTTTDDESYSSFSTLGETLSPPPPNRIQSLVRWW
jgi:hypothetical protein